MNDMTNSTKLSKQVPTSEEFSTMFGQTAWLMSLSKEHGQRSVAELAEIIAAPLMFKQLRVFTKGKQPLAAITWAYVTPDLAEKIRLGHHKMSLEDWRCGTEKVVVDCISPLADPQIFLKLFKA